MRKRGHAVRYPPCDDSLVAQVYGMLLDDQHVDSKLLGQVLNACPTLEDKVNLIAALLLQPPTDQQREWIEAFGLAWSWTDEMYRSAFKIEVIKSGNPEPVTDRDERTINYTCDFRHARAVQGPARESRPKAGEMPVQRDGPRDQADCQNKLRGRKL